MLDWLTVLVGWLEVPLAPGVRSGEVERVSPCGSGLLWAKRTSTSGATLEAKEPIVSHPR